MTASNNKLDEILYHVYESGTQSIGKWVRADHVGKPVSPEEAKQAIINYILEDVIPKKKIPVSKTTGIRVNGKGETYISKQHADKDIYLPEDAGYNQAIDDMRAKVLDKGDK